MDHVADACRPDWDLSLEYETFQHGVARLRATGVRLSPEDADDLFMKAMARACAIEAMLGVVRN